MRFLALILSLGFFASTPAIGGLTGVDDLLRGDVDNNGTVIALDVDYLVSYLYVGGPTPECKDAADCNDDGDIDNADVIVLANYVYNAINNIPAPGPINCGEDPTSDALGCAFPDSC